MSSLLIEAGPGTGKTFTVSAITMYLRATNKDIWLKNNPKLTQEQRAILDWCETNLPVTPKTSIIGMAYNKEAADQLGKRTHSSVECRSVHGWGYKTLLSSVGYLKINQNRGVAIVERITGRPFNSLENKYKWLSTLRFFEKLKDEMLEPTVANLDMLAKKYEDLAQFKVHNQMVEQIQQLIPRALQLDRTLGIEYIDQVWLACFKLNKPSHDIAIVDECQDISPARRMLCNKIAHHTIWIGDTFQAINAFAGADPNSIQHIRELVDEELPLKMSFRCPPYVINKLNARYPKANLKGLPREDSRAGMESRITLGEMPAVIKNDINPANYMIICRTNAPLIRAAYALIKENIPCRILGDRVIDQLCVIVNRIKATSFDDFENKLNIYEERVSKGLDDYVKELFQDKIKCIRIVLNHVDCIDDIVPALKKLLKPSNKDYVSISTIHKAKGQEAINVMILFPPIESPRAKSEEQKQQESNLCYVAESRTSLNTYWVTDE